MPSKPKLGDVKNRESIHGRHTYLVELFHGGVWQIVDTVEGAAEAEKREHEIRAFVKSIIDEAREKRDE